MATRKDKEFNHTLIHDSYIDLIKSLKRRPTYQEIADKTGLSYNTIKNHMKAIKTGAFSKYSESDLKLMTEDVLLGLLKSCLKGNSSSIKLWMQLVEGWKESSDLTSGGKPIKAPQMAPILLGNPFGKVTLEKE